MNAFFNHPLDSALPLLRNALDYLHALAFYRVLLLSVTLAGITAGLAAVRLVDGRGVPALLLRVPLLGVAVLTLACVAGLVPGSWALGLATGSVLLLLVDEALYLACCALGELASVLAAIRADLRRLGAYFGSFRPFRKPAVKTARPVS